MLIVVAIIAILIAISIPLINNALDKARHATDAANERAAKAEILIQYMADNSTIAPGTVYFYDAAKGTVGTSKPTVKYGKHKTSHEIIAVKLEEDDSAVIMQWTTVSGTLSDVTAGTDLCSEAKDVAHSS